MRDVTVWVGVAQGMDSLVSQPTPDPSVPDDGAQDDQPRRWRGVANPSRTRRS